MTCRVLEVSTSSHYAWRGRPESQRRQANHELAEQIRAAHKHGRARRDQGYVPAGTGPEGAGHDDRRGAWPPSILGLAGVPRRRLPADVEQWVRLAARDRCGYCLSPQHLVMARLNLSTSYGEDNLWLACPLLPGNTASGPSAVVVELKDSMRAVDRGLKLESAETGGAD